MRKPFDNPDGNPEITDIPISDESDEPGAASARREPEIVSDAEGEPIDPFYEAARAAEDRYIRLMADFENYRRRAVKERESAEVNAVENAVRPLLDVLDNLERALAHADNSPGPLRDGVALTVRQFQDALRSAGILSIEPVVGERFDPVLHEAISTMPDRKVAHDDILHVVSRGYRYGDRVIRPAKVVVSSGREEGRAAS